MRWGQTNKLKKKIIRIYNDGDKQNYNWEKTKKYDNDIQKTQIGKKHTTWVE